MAPTTSPLCALESFPRPHQVCHGHFFCWASITFTRGKASERFAANEYVFTISAQPPWNAEVWW
jgi:hypothetical protein